MTHNTAELLELSSAIGAAAAAVGSGAVINAAQSSEPNQSKCFDTSAPAANDESYTNYEGAVITPISDKIDLTATCNAAFSGAAPEAPKAAPIINAPAPEIPGQ